MDTDDFYLKAFWDLSTTRQFGLALGPIPWNFIQDYGVVKGLDPDNLDVFLETISEMDRVYLEWESAEAEARRKANEKK